MKRLPASLLAAGLVFAGNAFGQSSGQYGQDEGYYDSGRYASQDSTYDYARVLRVDPVIGPDRGYAPTGSTGQCYETRYDDVYASDADDHGYRDAYDPGDRQYRRDDYRGRDDGYADARGNETSRTVATVIGGIAGAVLGSKIGDGSGRYVGTAVGSMVGGMAGRSIYDSSQRSRQLERHGTVRVCDPEPVASRDGYYDDDERLSGYDVTYEYANRTYHTRTNYHPGDRIRVRVDVRAE